MVKSMFKGVLCSVIATLLFVLVFAFIVQVAGLSNSVISPVMQVVKVLAIFVAVLIALKPARSKGWLYGGLVGIFYMVITFLVFSLLDGQFVINISALSDLLFETLVGLISAVLIRMRNKDVEVV
ncbi:MAG: TIGR04086 family membrane protein [Clostridia bacterium]|nr:TIGR04086 family membrane protein [Clostridia bacterium]